jgi:DNA-binding transcriptional regulator YhcF (GntR family)
VSPDQEPEIGGRENAQWVKAAGGLADGIRTGRYAPGERLPALADMAAAAVVHPRVMSRALRRLRDLGYVVYRRGYGYYVSEAPPGFG